jgi:hypothetical protein
MPLDQNTFAQTVDALRSGIISALVGIRQPGATAESLIPAVVSMIAANSDANRTLSVVSASMQYAGSAPNLDVFLFSVRADWVDGSGDVGLANVQVLRQDLEGV